jgi:hypothetical protein
MESVGVAMKTSGDVIRKQRLREKKKKKKKRKN